LVKNYNFIVLNNGNGVKQLFSSYTIPAQNEQALSTHLKNAFFFGYNTLQLKSLMLLLKA